MVGVPFRMHGRDPGIGLDCVGLIGAAMERAGLTPTLPRRYDLRNRSGIEAFLPMAEQSGLKSSRFPPARNDIVLYGLEGFQHHLAVSLGQHRIVHAHAGLRRVLVSTPNNDWRILKVWSVD